MFAEAHAVAKEEGFRIACTGRRFQGVVELVVAQIGEKGIGKAARVAAIFLKQPPRQPFRLRHRIIAWQLQGVFAVARRQGVFHAVTERRRHLEAVGRDPARRYRHLHLPGMTGARFRRQIERQIQHRQPAQGFLHRRQFIAHHAVFPITEPRRAFMHLARTLMPLNTVKKPQHRPAPVELIQIRARVAEEADAEGDLVRLRQRRQIAHMHFFRQARLCAALLRHAPQRLHAREKEKHCGGERQGDGKHPHHITPAGELHPRPPQLLEAQQPAQADHQRKEQIEKHRNRLRIHQKRQHQQHLQQKQHMHIAAVARFQQLAHAHRHQHCYKRHRHPHRM